jgi:Carbohydrate binding module (family 6)
MLPHTFCPRHSSKNGGVKIETAPEISGGQDHGSISNGDWMAFKNGDFYASGLTQIISRLLSGAAAGINGLLRVLRGLLLVDWFVRRDDFRLPRTFLYFANNVMHLPPPSSCFYCGKGCQKNGGKEGYFALEMHNLYSILLSLKCIRILA